MRKLYDLKLEVYDLRRKVYDHIFTNRIIYKQTQEKEFRSFQKTGNGNKK